MKYDLAWCHNHSVTWVSEEVAAKAGIEAGSHSHRFMSEVPDSERGHQFLLAFTVATDNTYLGEFCEDEDGRLEEILEMRIPHEEWESLKRQTRLAAVTLVEDPELANWQ